MTCIKKETKTVSRSEILGVSWGIYKGYWKIASAAQGSKQEAQVI